MHWETPLDAEFFVLKPVHLGSFLGKSSDIIKDIIAPIRPVVDLQTTTEVHLGITTFQSIELAY